MHFVMYETPWLNALCQIDFCHSQDNCIGHLMNLLPCFSHLTSDTSAAVKKGFLGSKPAVITIGCGCKDVGKHY